MIAAGPMSRALQSLLSARGRTLLLAMVVSISMASLALTVSFVSSMYRIWVFQSDMTGRRSCFISTAISPFAQPNASKHYLDLDDLKMLREHLAGRATFYPGSGTSRMLSAGGQHARSFVLGQDPIEFTRKTSYAPILKDGRLIREDDLESLSRVCVLNVPARNALFKNGTAVGQEIRVGDMPFQVVGVVDFPALMGWKGKNCVIYIPLTTCMRRLLNVTALNYMNFDVADGYDIEGVAKEVAHVLRQRHGITPPKKDDFLISTPGQAQEEFKRSMHTVKGVGALIVSVALLLAIGVLGQVQWLSVNHRTAEIGIRRAVGASRSDILKEFLAESLLLTLFGAIAGLLLTSACIPIFRLAFYEAPSDYSSGSLLSPFTHLHIDGWVMAACALATLLIGLAAGALPAHRAGRLDAVEALR